LSIARFVITRLALAIGTVAVISAITFFATNVIPGDTAKAALGRFATPDQVQSYRQQQGLDKPIAERYVYWITHIAQGDWGTSLLSKVKVTDLVVPRLLRSLGLALGAMLIAVPLAYIVGVYAGQRTGKPVDIGLSLAALFVNSLPEFVVGLALLVILAVKVPVLPIESSGAAFGIGLEVPMAYALPILTLATVLTPYMARMVRTNVHDVSLLPFVRSAILRGLSLRRVTWRHIVPNASLPVVNVVALSLAELVGGVVITETVFGFPGVGKLLVDSVTSKDLPTVQVIVLVMGVGYVTMNLVADLLVLALNPRLRTQKR
jgi:peptide/nickel transport system permease protein